jgi:hypothetical protein
MNQRGTVHTCLDIVRMSIGVIWCVIEGHTIQQAVDNNNTRTSILRRAPSSALD